MADQTRRPAAFGWVITCEETETPLRESDCTAVTSDQWPGRAGFRTDSEDFLVLMGLSF